MAAGILQQLPERMQADVAYRMATLESVHPAVVQELEEALEASFAEILRGLQNAGGPKVVADMINLTGSSVEKNVLDQMDAQDPEIAEAVRNLMFTFEDIVKLTDHELEILLREISEEDMAVALKSGGEELRQRMLGNLSEQARTSVVTEMEQLAPMRMDAVESTQLRCVQQARQLEEQGKLRIVRGDADDTWV